MARRGDAGQAAGLSTPIRHRPSPCRCCSRSASAERTHVHAGPPLGVGEIKLLLGAETSRRVSPHGTAIGIVHLPAMLQEKQTMPEGAWDLARTDDGRAGTGNWHAFQRPLDDVYRAAEAWRQEMAGVERPWLCWNVNDDWCLISAATGTGCRMDACCWLGFEQRCRRATTRSRGLGDRLQSAPGAPRLVDAFPIGVCVSLDGAPGVLAFRPVGAPTQAPAPRAAVRIVT